MLTDAEISIAIADLDPEPKSPVDGFECVYRETRKLIEELIDQEKQRKAAIERAKRLREWALWIAAGVLVAAVVWGLQ